MSHVRPPKRLRRPPKDNGNRAKSETLRRGQSASVVGNDQFDRRTGWYKKAKAGGRPSTGLLAAVMGVFRR